MEPLEMDQLLGRILKLDTLPVAAGLVPTGEKPVNEPLELKLNNCQLISIARHRGEYSSGVPKRMVCAIGAACVGLVETPEEFVNGTAALGKYSSSASAGREFFKNTFKTGDRSAPFSAIQFAPLRDVPFKPSVVIVYGNPAQIMRLVHANAWTTGEATLGDTVAEAAVCSSIGLAIEEDRAVLGLPCAGDRRFGGTQNHEMVFVAPFARMKETIMPSLKEMFELSGSLYPIAPSVLFETVMPDSYTLKP